MSNNICLESSIKKKEIKKVAGLTSILILLITLLPLSGCGQNENKITNDELEKNIRLWQESKISDYNFVIYKMTLGTLDWVPTLIKVRNSRACVKSCGIKV